MNRTLLCFLLLSMTFHLFGQEYQSEDFKIKIDSTLKTKYLSKILPLEGFCLYLDSENDTLKTFIEFHGEKFTFHHSINRDTVIIFDGKECGGHESGAVFIYKLSNGKPKRILSRIGKISKFSNDKVIIYTYPCCADVINIISVYDLFSGDKIGSSHVFYSRKNYKKVLESLNLNNYQQFQLINTTQLRFSASETDRLFYTYCDGNSTNIILELSNKKYGDLIHESEDKNWVFARFDNMKTTNGYCFNQFHKRCIVNHYRPIK